MKEIFKEGSFTDFTGQSRNVTIYVGVTDFAACCGYAVQNPVDKYDANIGKTIAKNRSQSKSGLLIQANFMGILKCNAEIIADMYLNYLLSNPAIMIKGYNVKKNQYNNIQKAKHQWENLSDTTKANMRYLSVMSEKDIEKAKFLMKYAE